LGTSIVETVNVNTGHSGCSPGEGKWRVAESSSFQDCTHW